MDLKNEEYEFERLNGNNMSDLVLLYKNTFNTSASAEFFKKKFNTSHIGISHIGFLAYAKDKTPAAFYGVFPCWIEYKGNTILAAQSGDTMTDPKHQGKGLFTRLAKMTYELAEKEGIKLVFGFPNKNSYPGFTKKLNWIHRHNIRTYNFKINTLPLIKAAKKFNTSELYGNYAKALLKKYFSTAACFPNSSIDPEHAGVVHDRAFCLYKGYSKNFILKLDNDVSLWVKLDGKLWIGDVDRTPSENFITALRKLQRLCFFLGCSEITFNISPDSYWDRILSKK